MGIDAEMFVRVKGRDKWLNEAQALDLSYRLASTVGHQSFFIVQADEERAFCKPRHALSIMHPWGSDPDDYADDYYPEHRGKVIWTQDGDAIIADDDEQFIKVNLWTRYYGEGYERGDWLIIKTTAEFLEEATPGATVWYGGDSSGVCAELFNTYAREKLHRHWLANGRRPYARGFSNLRVRNLPICPTCQVPMFSSGGGQDREFANCDGCGREEVVWSSGRRVRVPRGKSTFDISNNPDVGIPVADPARAA